MIVKDSLMSITVHNSQRGPCAHIRANGRKNTRKNAPGGAAFHRARPRQRNRPMDRSVHLMRSYDRNISVNRLKTKSGAYSRQSAFGHFVTRESGAPRRKRRRQLPVLHVISAWSLYQDLLLNPTEMRSVAPSHDSQNDS